MWNLTPPSFFSWQAINILRITVKLLLININKKIAIFILRISNIEKHRTALNQVVDKEYNIILEDDVIISKDFIKNIEELFADLSILDNIDMLWPKVSYS